MSELHDLTALEQSRAIRSGRLTSAELTEHYLHRTERHGSTLGAFITVTPDEALAQARDLDRQLAGTPDPESLSPLFGTVAPVKDLDLVAGVRCTFGSRVFVDNVAPADSHFVTRMRAAGLVITGKTNTPEMGLPCYTENDIAPPARTPWDTRKSAGGSSGGAAAAVAGALASVAQGSDGGGSIRIPASVTGLVGIKPSRGRTSFSPFPAGVGELACVGPLARTVRDAAALLDVLADVPASEAIPPAPGGGFLRAADEAPGRLRVGRWSDPILADAELDAACVSAYESATEILRGLGHEVVDIPAPLNSDLVPTFEVLWCAGAAALPVPPEREEELLPLTRHLRERGRTLSAVDLAAAIARTRIAAAAAIEATADCDVLLSPTLARLPVLVGELRNDADPAADFEAQKRFTPFTAPFNVTGQPAMSIPLATSAAGLPVGVQLVGRPFREDTLIALAAQVEDEVRWQDRFPPFWAATPD